MASALYAVPSFAQNAMASMFGLFSSKKDSESNKRFAMQARNDVDFDVKHSGCDELEEE
jgi:hypothetical protein